MTYYTHSELETEQLAERLAPLLRPGTVIAFDGDLGAGKTAFTRGLARGLGITDRVTSPTYTIVNEYDGKVPLFHFDMYRLASSEELFDIGWEDYLDRGGICALEWSERAEGLFGPETVKVTLRRLDETRREITVSREDETC